MTSLLSFYTQEVLHKKSTFFIKIYVFIRFFRTQFSKRLNLETIEPIETYQKPLTCQSNSFNRVV